MKKRLSEQKIKKEIHELYCKLIEKRPSHFSVRDIINAFFGSLIIGVAFVLKGAVVRTSQNFINTNIIALIIGTLLILTAQIYFIGWTRVIRKKQRGFLQFWLKRLITLYLIAIITSSLLIFMYGLNNMAVSSQHLFNILIAISLPCAVGAAVPSLMKHY